jgi:hypothetical protein
VGWLRRRKETLNERLMREAGLVEQPRRPLFTGVIPETGIHGIPRQREYEAVVTTEAPEAAGSTALFVGLADGSLVVEEGEGDLTSLAEAIERDVAPPYRATAIRRGRSRWAVAAHGIRVIELPEPGGDEIELVLQNGGKTLTVDGTSSFGSLRELEALAEGRDAVIRAARLDGSLWEVRVDPL